MHPIIKAHYRRIGQKGGQSKSLKKIQASKENGKKGGRPVGKKNPPEDAINSNIPQKKEIK